MEVVELDLPFVRPQDAAQAAKGGGLAGSVLSEQEEDFTRANLEVDVGNRLDAAKPLPQPADRDHCEIVSRRSLHHTWWVRILG